MKACLVQFGCIFKIANQQQNNVLPSEDKKRLESQKASVGMYIFETGKTGYLMLTYSMASIKEV